MEGIISRDHEGEGVRCLPGWARGAPAQQSVKARSFNGYVMIVILSDNVFCSACQPTSSRSRLAEWLVHVVSQVTRTKIFNDTPGLIKV
jgi:hypothetical protein